MSGPTDRLVRASSVVAVVIVVAAIAGGCSRQDRVDVAGATSTSTAAGAEAPTTGRADATTSTTSATAPDTTTSRNTPSSSPGKVGADRLGGIDTLELEALGSGEPYRRYAEVRDDSGRASVEVPQTWDTDTQIRTIQGVSIPSIVASPDLSGYYGGDETPGVRLAAYEGALGDRGVDWALEHEAEVDHVDECIGPSERFAFEARGYRGGAVVTARCGPRGQMVVVHIAAEPDSGAGSLAVISANAVSDADAEALARLIASFEVPAA